VSSSRTPFALVSGDIEFYMLLYGGSLAVQGMASLFGFAEKVSNVNPM